MLGKSAVGGVGALVGGPEEEGVALLPDERNEGSKKSSTTPSSHVARDQLPSRDTEGNENLVGKSAVRGVGALVGGPEEEGVARLPEERNAGLRERDLARPKDTTAKEVDKKERRETGVVENY